jgi:hypothetical protein
MCKGACGWISVFRCSNRNGIKAMPFASVPMGGLSHYRFVRSLDFYDFERAKIRLF